MKVTNVKINEIEGAGSTKAFVTLEFDKQLVVSGFRIIDGKSGLFISMPQRKHNDEYFDVVYPNSKKGREALSDIIINEYKKYISKEENSFN